MNKVVIIDDEQRARISLSLLIENFCPEIEIVAQCENLPQGVKAIRKLKPNLVFLDIEMPGHSGLELLDFFDEDEIDFKIIFTTAYQEYAIQAFKFSAVDYLLKPINPEELTQAINRYVKEQQKKDNYKILKENVKEEFPKKMAIPTGNTLLFITIDQVIFIKGEGAYAEVFCQNNSKYLVSRNLKNFEETLCAMPNFTRVHKSYIINTNHLKAYNKSDGGSIEMIENYVLPIATDKIPVILKATEYIKR